MAYLGRIDEARVAAQAGLTLEPTFTIGRFRAGARSDNPVRRITRIEEYAIGSARPAFQGYAKLGFREDGRMTAADLRVYKSGRCAVPIGIGPISRAARGAEKKQTRAKRRRCGFCLRDPRLLLRDLRGGGGLPQNRGEGARPRATQQAPPLNCLLNCPSDQLAHRPAQKVVKARCAES